MRELELNAIKELIKIYEFFLINGLDKKTSEKAKILYNKLIPGNTLLNKDINIAFGKLFNIAYTNTDPDRKVPTNNEIKKIILNLKKLKQKLENESFSK